MRLSLSILLLVACLCSVAAQYGLRNPGYLAGLSSRAGGSSSFGLSKSNLLFAYDFSDASDSHSGAYHLSESNSPSYSSGIGSISVTATSFWRQASVTALYNTNASSPYTIAGRFRVHAGTPLGRYFFTSHQNRNHYRYQNPSNTVKIAQNLTVVYTTPYSTNQWLNVVAVYDGTTNRSVTVNGAVFSASEAHAQNVGPLLIGTDSTTGAYSATIDADWFYGWGRALTSNEIAKIMGSDSNNGIVYGSLDP